MTFTPPKNKRILCAFALFSLLFCNSQLGHSVTRAGEFTGQGVENTTTATKDPRVIELQPGGTPQTIQMQPGTKEIIKIAPPQASSSGFTKLPYPPVTQPPAKLPPITQPPATTTESPILIKEAPCFGAKDIEACMKKHYPDKGGPAGDGNKKICDNNGQNCIAAVCSKSDPPICKPVKEDQKKVEDLGDKVKDPKGDNSNCFLWGEDWATGKSLKTPTTQACETWKGNPQKDLAPLVGIGGLDNLIKNIQTILNALKLLQALAQLFDFLQKGPLAMLNQALAAVNGVFKDANLAGALPNVEKIGASIGTFGAELASFGAINEIVPGGMASIISNSGFTPNPAIMDALTKAESSALNGAATMAFEKLNEVIL